jgi:UDP-glucose 4-epimerase
VFHLAADMGGVEYFHSDHDFGAALDNQLITTNVLKACVAKQTPRLVYTSSVCAYPVEHMNDGMLVNEQWLMTGTPDAMYGAEKRQGAWMVANAPIDGRVALLDTVYGPGQEHHGIRMKFPSAVCVHAIESLQTDELVLFGDGTQERCYLYIEDAVQRLIAMASAPKPDHMLPVWNIGGTELVTCQAVAEMCLEYVNSDALICYNPLKPTGVLTRRTDQAKFARTFGDLYETTIDEGFSKFLDWLLSL